MNSNIATKVEEFIIPNEQFDTFEQYAGLRFDEYVLGITNNIEDHLPRNRELLELSRELYSFLTVPSPENQPLLDCYQRNRQLFVHNVAFEQLRQNYFQDLATNNYVN